MRKFLFWPEEQAAFKPPTKEELAEIDELSRTWDADPVLQAQYANNFYEFLAQSLKEKG